MHSYIRPNSHIALRLPSGIVKIHKIVPNTTINIGKFGTFPANLLLGRPYYLTFELLDKENGRSKTELRIVPASELHAEALGGDHATPAESRDDSASAEGGAEFDIVGDDGEVIMRSNRLTIDDPSRQTLAMEEIEELKKAGAGSGKEIIAKIMASHLGIDEKTSFSLAKYTLRKSKKYLKRFTVLPLDVGLLNEYVLDKEGYKIMDLREESLGLISSWANIHCADASRVLTADDDIGQIGGGRWLVIDDTGGLVVAALAEKMRILYPEEDEEDQTLQEGEDINQDQNGEGDSAEDAKELQQETYQNGTTPPKSDPETKETDPTSPTSTTRIPSNPPPPPCKPPRQHIPQSTAQTNSLTVLHANNQPNLSFLKYFGFDTGNPTTKHPLYHNLKSLSWLQLLYPHEDPSYDEPEVVADDVLATFKSSKRGNYYKKRRRWERTSRIVNETRRGGFDGLIVASAMEPASILKECVPLVKGGGRIVVYSPNVEPLVELCDYYSKDRRAAFVSKQMETNASINRKAVKEVKKEDNEANGIVGEDEDEDFPVNPTLLLAPSLQTARARQWQVLPSRTHPMMTSRGGAEGYLFTATRVLPFEGKVEARGKFRSKKRKTGADSSVQA
ncbi:eukaryotic translation initiation factor 3, gamma subunit [Lojkania enalia]|uniref:tRNA (adenine(58)-N(1))-methyltransferase non-catalytic subunit TRM6 n=1 Tax=Lojkania enalia TaxID=147567 RepID=A0A9P4K6V2_9PLEO|nr:eukaryotic translation initiation factor 3, gamma subunit [Didymosphaeria enalia]